MALKATATVFKPPSMKKLNYHNKTMCHSNYVELFEELNVFAARGELNTVLAQLMRCRDARDATFSKHKTRDMVNVKNKRCEHEGCEKLSRNFDVPGGQGRFCSKHKTCDMIDVKTKKCEHEGCEILSRNYDVPGGRGRFCSKLYTF
jgi:hypothetical protein